MTTNDCLFEEIQYLRSQLVDIAEKWKESIGKNRALIATIKHIRDFAKLNLDHNPNRALQDIYHTAEAALEATE